MSKAVNKAQLFATLPPPWPEDMCPQIRAAVASQPSHKLIVLDDDPTGTQTVHDVPVLTVWDVDTLRGVSTGTVFYILTNSRSLPADAAGELNREIARHLREAVWRNEGFTSEPDHSRQLCCHAFTLISRSDSTLRGHYPLETDVLTEELGPFDATILIPYFEAGGRYTIGDVHYVAEGDVLVPAAETPFARDPASATGRQSSGLRRKTAGRSRPRMSSRSRSRNCCAGRRMANAPRFMKLLRLQHSATAIVNACASADLEFFAVGRYGQRRQVLDTSFIPPRSLWPSASDWSRARGRRSEGECPELDGWKAALRAPVGRSHRGRFLRPQDHCTGGRFVGESSWCGGSIRGGHSEHGAQNGGVVAGISQPTSAGNGGMWLSSPVAYHHEADAGGSLDIARRFPTPSLK
jgi:hypothetical protein